MHEWINEWTLTIQQREDPSLVLPTKIQHKISLIAQQQPTPAATEQNFNPQKLAETENRKS